MSETEEQRLLKLEKYVKVLIVNSIMTVNKWLAPGGIITSRADCWCLYGAIHDLRTVGAFTCIKLEHFGLKGWLFTKNFSAHHFSELECLWLTNDTERLETMTALEFHFIEE